jgi:hypothetical protein
MQNYFVYLPIFAFQHLKYQKFLFEINCSSNYKLSLVICLLLICTRLESTSLLPEKNSSWSESTTCISWSESDISEFLSILENINVKCRFKVEILIILRF